MRYIKKYENSENSSLMDEPEKGDYVICDENIGNNWRLKVLKNFLANNIGKITSNSSANGYYFVYYSNWGDDLSIIDYFNNPSPGCRQMSREEIKYYSKNREDLEIIIDANKYNL